MTYQATIVSKLESAAENLRDLAPEQDGLERRKRWFNAAKARDSMAAQFAAGDFDESLMGEYAKLFDGTDTGLDTANASDEVVSEIGFEDGYASPDDVLSEIVRRAQA